MSPLTTQASPAVPYLEPLRRYQAQSLPWSSAGSWAADAQSRMESSLALPCCVASARLTEYVLVCVWKLNSCSSGTQETDLPTRERPRHHFPQPTTTTLLAQRREGCISSAESLHFPARVPRRNGSGASSCKSTRP